MYILPSYFSYFSYCIGSSAAAARRAKSEMVRLLQLTGGNEEIGLGSERFAFLGFLVDADICKHSHSGLASICFHLSAELTILFVLDSIPSLTSTSTKKKTIAMSPAATIDQLKALLPPSSVHEPGTPSHRAQSLPWSQHAEANPKLVVTPSDLTSLQNTLKLLCEDSAVDFAVRNTGTGCASARDVILSMQGFKDFAFDEEAEVVTLGAGLDWGEVEVLMAAQAPGWALVGARCGWVGVAGGALVGGYSWLSHEFGLISDPQNLLDVQVVLRDGRVVWASEEDNGELLWGMRGGGGNFGVVTALKMRARRYREAIFAGMAFLPYERLEEVGKWVEAMVERKKDPKLAFAVTNQGPGIGKPAQGARPGVAVYLFDANGEEHARSKGYGFGELLAMEGIEVSGGMVPLSGMTKLADSYRSYQGVNKFWGSAPLLEEKVDAELIMRAWTWYEKSIEAYPELDEGSTILFEFGQEVRYASQFGGASTL
jgi:hypothetical protein